VNGAASPVSVFGQAFQIKAPVNVPEETGGTVVPALNNVQRYAGGL
jgi:hypothetical protein